MQKEDLAGLGCPVLRWQHFPPHLPFEAQMLPLAEQGPSWQMTQSHSPSLPRLARCDWVGAGHHKVKTWGLPGYPAPSQALSTKMRPRTVGAECSCGCSQLRYACHEAAGQQSPASPPITGTGPCGQMVASGGPVPTLCIGSLHGRLQLKQASSTVHTGSAFVLAS